MKLYLCNYPFKTLHCLQQCFHGMKPHPLDECSTIEYCPTVDENVKCKPLTKKEMEEYASRTIDPKNVRQG